MILRTSLAIILVLLSGGLNAQHQSWSLSECINHAVMYNLQVRQADLNTEVKQANLTQLKASRFPTLDASARQNFSWANQQNSTGDYEFEGNNSTTFSINSGLTLYNGFRRENGIKQSLLVYQSAELAKETIKQNISLQVLDYYLQVLYAEEQLLNSINQLLATSQQLELANERLNLRAISQADFLQIQSQYASEKSSQANSAKQLLISRLNLMQLLEIPVNDSFEIVRPVIDDLILLNLPVESESTYQHALEIRPEIKSAVVQKQVAGYDLKIAEGSFMPVLSVNAGLNTSYNSLAEGLKYASQLDRNLSPSISLSLSVPIFQQKQNRTQISLAKISIASAEINETEVRNQLRKSIENAWAEAISSIDALNAAISQKDAAEASFAAATERYNVGLINTVDFLYSKTSLITAESILLQARYNAVFSYKVLEFYQGKDLSI